MALRKYESAYIGMVFRRLIFIYILRRSPSERLDHLLLQKELEAGHGNLSILENNSYALSLILIFS